MEYTKADLKRDMLKMWLWLSENPEKTKNEYLKEHPEVKCGSCPTCYYDNINCEGYCECFFKWDGININSDCGDKYSYHDKWVISVKSVMKVGYHIHLPLLRSKAMYAKEIYKIALRMNPYEGFEFGIDGNMICCVRTGGFQLYPNCSVGFGITEAEAYDDLIKDMENK